MSAKTETRYSLAVETVIATEVEKVWHLLVDPVELGKLFWGSTVESDFKAGSPIVWKGMWEGKAFQDDGKITRVEKNSLLQCTHWSPTSGTPESPNLLTWELTKVKGGVRVVMRHENIASLEMKEHSEPMWKQLLERMKDTLEGGKGT